MAGGGGIVESESYDTVWDTTSFLENIWDHEKEGSMMSGVILWSSFERFCMDPTSINWSNIGPMAWLSMKNFQKECCVFVSLTD